MKMRMQELAERSRLPKTTIHHYAREELLPPAHKTAPNAAEYDEQHLERLALITRLREDEDGMGALSIPEIRRVLEHVDAGADLRVAVRLVKEGVEPEPTADGSWTSPADLAEASGLAAEFVEALVTAGLVGALRDDGGFTSADLLIARACDAVCGERGLDPADLSPLADLIREVGNYSATLADVHGARASEAGAGEPTGELGRDLARLCDVLLWRVMQV